MEEFTDVIDENRLGRFYIDREILEDDLPLVAEIQSDVIIVKAEMDFAADHIEFWGYSPKFDPIDKGSHAPIYSITIERVDDPSVGIFNQIDSWEWARETDHSSPIGPLRRALAGDEGYRLTWVANLAMAIHDTPRSQSEQTHEWRNRCAETFLDRLMSDSG